MLYNFEKLEDYLISIDVKIIDEDSGYKIIKGVNFEEAYKEGVIEFRSNGIYIVKDEEEYRGYMFIKYPFIVQYNTYPRFHLVKCKTIDEFLTRGTFNQRYEWSNADKNDLIDKTTRKVYKDEVLELCSNCKNQIYDEIDDTIDFNELVKLDLAEIPENISVDVLGYTQFWHILSRKYRKEKKWTCEECNINLYNISDGSFLHVHHINSDKLDNKKKNLKCVCILCHSFQNPQHISNFRNSKQLEQFLIKHKKYLSAQNQYFSRIREVLPDVVL